MHADVFEKIRALAVADLKWRNAERAKDSAFFPSLSFEAKEVVRRNSERAWAEREAAIYLLLVATGHAQEMQDQLDADIAKAAVVEARRG